MQAKTTFMLYVGADRCVSREYIKYALHQCYVFIKNPVRFAKMDYTTRMLSNPPENVHSAVRPTASSPIILVLIMAPRY